MQYKKSSVILIFNDKAELALQLRAAQDDSYPSHWDFSCAGGMEVGEVPYETAVRELQEEIGIAGNPQPIGEILYRDEFKEDYLYLFRLTHNGPFIPDPKEVTDEQFFSLDQVNQMIHSGMSFHPEFLFVWRQGLIHP
jgi:isopentenyldiphosphate isomerase